MPLLSRWPEKSNVKKVKSAMKLVGGYYSSTFHKTFMIIGMTTLMPLCQAGPWAHV